MKGSTDCCICSDKIDLHLHPVTGKVYWDKGHNANPIKDGRCCDDCNSKYVIPERITAMTRRTILDRVKIISN